MPKGQPKKKHTTHPDNWDHKPEMEEVLHTSSLPIEGFSEQTKGFQPRTRSASTREAELRTQKFIDYYSKSAIESYQGKTHMPDNYIPEGYSFMWARESCRGRPDPTNIKELEDKHGWEKLPAENAPHKAYYDSYGNIDDSASYVRNGGLIAMIRPKEITEAQLNFYARLRNKNTRMQAQLRSRDGDLHPFSNQSNHTNNNAFFPSDEMSRSFASSFSY